MQREISFSVDLDVYEKFNMALSLSGDTLEEAADSCLRWYIAQVFGNASKEYKPRVVKQTDSGSRDFYGKALQLLMFR